MPNYRESSDMKLFIFGVGFYGSPNDLTQAVNSKLEELQNQDALDITVQYSTCATRSDYMTSIYASALISYYAKKKIL